MKCQIRDQVQVSTNNGVAQVCSFSGLHDNLEHIAVVYGNALTQKAPICRVHSECLTGDVFGSRRCDCGNQLKRFIELASQQGGILLYLRQEGRGIGIYNKIKAYQLQDKGFDTFEANRRLGFADDSRTFEDGARMLQALNIQNVRLITNNPEKVRQLKVFGVAIDEVIQIPTPIYPENRRYLEAKRQSGHVLELNEVLYAIS